MDGNPNQPKGQQQDPDERIENQRRQGKRPTDYEENAP
jgi:hypothetical protein